MSVRPFRSGVILRLGTNTRIHVNVYSALSKEETFSSYCNEDHSTAGHDGPAKPNQILVCPICDANRPVQEVLVDKREFAKGRVVDDQIVLVPKDAIDGTKAPEELKGQMTLTPHPLPEVLYSTIAGGSVYYISAAQSAIGRKSGVKNITQAELDQDYAILRMILKANPDVAFLAEWAPSSKAGLWRLAMFGDIVTLTQLARPDALREQPELPMDEMDGLELSALDPFKIETLDEIIPGLALSSFDPSQYADTARAARDDLAEKAMRGELDVLAPASSTPSSNVLSLKDRILAKVAEESKPAAKPRARKKVAS